jgi:hypothetical protein
MTIRFGHQFLVAVMFFSLLGFTGCSGSHSQGVLPKQTAASHARHVRDVGDGCTKAMDPGCTGKYPDTGQSCDPSTDAMDAAGYTCETNLTGMSLVGTPLESYAQNRLPAGQCIDVYGSDRSAWHDCYNGHMYVY